jgi:hypothetical protein
MIFIGDKGEITLLAKRPRGRLYTVVCFGSKRHYRKDGCCKHTDEVLARIKPDAKGRVRVDPWGGKPPDQG